MLKYLYIPEDEDVLDHIPKAIEENFNQIIHGSSDIIKDILINENSVQSISIPEFVKIDPETLVFYDGHTVVFSFTDEFIDELNYNNLRCVLYKVDDNNPKINKKYKTVYPEKVNNYLFSFSFQADRIGEYIVELVCDLENIETIRYKTELIICQSLNEQHEDDDGRFLFE